MKTKNQIAQTRKVITVIFLLLGMVLSAFNVENAPAHAQDKKSNDNKTGYVTASEAINTLIDLHDSDPNYDYSYQKSSDVNIEGEWAYSDVIRIDRLTGQILLSSGEVIIAHQDKNRSWVARKPEDGFLFNEWLDQIPVTLLDTLVKDMVRYFTSPEMSVTADVSEHYLPWPSPSGARITTNYNNHGTGQIDFAIDVVDIIATKAGTIVYANDSHPDWAHGTNNSYATYNNVVVIQHTATEYTLYLHLKNNSIPAWIKSGCPNGSSGQTCSLTVARGQKIGEMGTTGWSTGNHLHLSTASSYYIDRNNPDWLDEDADGNTTEITYTAFTSSHITADFIEYLYYSSGCETTKNCLQYWPENDSNNKVYSQNGGCDATSRPSEYIKCAEEGSGNFCSFSGLKTVYYGANSCYAVEQKSNGVECVNGNFGGDPLPGVHKACYIQPTTCPQSGGVILYWNANYDCNNDIGDAGYRLRSTTGWQNVNDGQFNDKASSVRVPSGWSVMLYENADRGVGGNKCFNTDIGDFGTQGNFPGTTTPINDRVSSMEVFQDSTCGIPTYPVTIYTSPSNGGTPEGWPNSGSYNLSSSVNDQGSSIQIADGWSARVFEHGSEGGGEKCYNSSDSDFNGDTYDTGGQVNESVSSIIVYNQENCPSLDAVILYERNNLEGQKQSWNFASSYNLTTLDNISSSVRIQPGWSARVYQDPNKGGGQACFDSTDTDFAGNTFNNGTQVNEAISSIEVYQQESCPPLPTVDLVPYPLDGRADPVIVSSVPGTVTNDTLYAGKNVYMDWGFKNIGNASISTNFYVDLYIDSQRFIHYPYASQCAGCPGGFGDWSEVWNQPGWHTVKLIVDPENTVAETNESNNEWSKLFYWNGYELTIIKTGFGNGTVTSDPAGINCGSVCSYVFPYNKSVSLTATPATGSAFYGWSGACTGSHDCVVAMTDDQSVTANFSKPGDADNDGRVGILDKDIWAAHFGMETSNGLADGDFNNDRFVTGVDLLIWRDNATTYTLTVNLAGTGNGTVTSDPAGINCPGDCSESIVLDTKVTLTASPSTGSAFLSWSGDDDCTDGQVTMDASKSCTATLNALMPPGAFNKLSPIDGVATQPTSLTLSWESSSGATSYEYCLDTVIDDACSTNWIFNGTSTSKALTGLTPGMLYEWHVRATNPDGTTYSNNSESAFWVFSTLPYPGNFFKIGPADGATNQPRSLTLIWGGSRYAVSYWYCYDTTNDNDCSNWSYAGSNTSTGIYFLEANTTYYWQVRAVNGSGTTYANEGSTSYWHFTTGNMPGAFNKTGPAVGAIDQPSNPTLTWKSSAGATSYEYCYDTTNDKACSTWVGNGTSTSKTLSSLNPNTTYYWQVRAINTGGVTYGDHSDIAFWSFTTGNLPGPFNKINPPDGAINQPTKVELAWETSSGASKYELCVDVLINDSCDTSWRPIPATIVTTSVTLPNLNLSTTYEWHVRAVNSGGTTYSNGNDPSAFWTFTTTSNPNLKPDLIIQSITLSPVQASQEVTFSVVVKNQGQIDASGFWVDLFIDNPFPSNCSNLAGQVYTRVPYLTVGASTTLSLSYAGFTAGNHTINGIADAHCEVNESNESNNTQSISVPVLVSISGNAGVGGATLIYTDGTVKTVTADGAGNYTITVPYGWSGTVTPSLASDVFCPASQTYSNISSNQTSQNYAQEACRVFDPVSKWTSAFDLSHGWTVADYVRTVGDVNGDGKADLIGFGQDGVYVALSNGTGFDPVSKWTSAFDLSHGWTVTSYVRTVGDVNNDGKADLIGFGQDGVYVALSNGSGFMPVSQWTSAFDLSHGWTVASYVRMVGDVNNDGKADLVGFGQDGVYVALSTGSGFGTVSKWTSAFDLSHGWTVKDYVRTVGDVNNDGNADLIGFGQDGVYVALSTGSGFGAVSKWTSAFDLSHGWTVVDYVRTVGDINGDGKADLVGFGQDGVYVALSTGSSFTLVSRLTTSYDLSHGWTVADYVRTVGDVSGDGKADLVGFGQDGVYIAK